MSKQIAAMKDRANALIKNCPTPEGREAIARLVTDLLMAAGAYSGFGYREWDEGGYSRWMKHGQPEDNTPYLGDKTQVKFY